VAAARLEVAVARLALWCAYLAALGIFGIVALLVTSSLKRYLFHTPIHVTEELGGLLFLATTFLAVTHGFVRNRHVRLELLWRVLPGRWRRLFEVLGHLMALLALAILIRETYAMAEFSYELRARSVMTELLLWPWRLLIPATLSLLLLAVALRTSVMLLKMAVGAPLADREDEASPAAGAR
jgi:TRAP-type C4-dicarboxylate transport system permease small subunit